MKVGANRKNVAVLAVLLVVAAVLFYVNVLSDSGAPPRESAPAAGSAPAVAVPPAPAARPAASQPQPAQVRRVGSRVRSSEDWRPSLKRRPEEAIDPTTIDPTLRLDVLAKVQAAQLEGGSRSVFQFSAPPPPPLPKEPKILPKGAVKVADQAKPVPAGPPKPPPPPPINLKYYGFSSARGTPRKTAFFLDGEEILVAAEGEVVKRRYKVVRIGVNSVVMEDLDSKSQQTLPLQADITA